jgi:glutathionylspermidine synthase
LRALFPKSRVSGNFADPGYNGSTPPKLLEYNADTPTSLLEASVIQWYWLQDVYKEADQFNSLHEKLIAKWKDVDSYLEKPIYFVSADNPEDRLTVAYLRDTAEQASLPTRQMLMQEIGWNEPRQCDTDPAENQIRSIFKLYPWETMLDESFATQALRTYKDMRWIEPIWKLLLSNKGILPVLWELYPNHELLLESHFVTSSSGWQPPAGWVRKPMHSSEGANIAMALPDGRPGHPDQRSLYRSPADRPAPRPSASFPDALRPGTNRYPVLGLWMIDQECCGMGIREDATPITGNLSSFVPHFFR